METERRGARERKKESRWKGGSERDKQGRRERDRKIEIESKVEGDEDR